MSGDSDAGEVLEGVVVVVEGRSGCENGDRNGLQFVVMVKGRVSSFWW